MQRCVDGLPYDIMLYQARPSLGLFEPIARPSQGVIRRGEGGLWRRRPCHVYVWPVIFAFVFFEMYHEFG